MISILNYFWLRKRLKLADSFLDWLSSTLIFVDNDDIEDDHNNDDNVDDADNDDDDNDDNDGSDIAPIFVKKFQKSFENFFEKCSS